MIAHLKLGNSPEERARCLSQLIRSGAITMAGYKKAKIYGHLTCSSGKRMKIVNRVFFKDEAEAISGGYRPCGNCMRQVYDNWHRIGTAGNV